MTEPVEPTLRDLATPLLVHKVLTERMAQVRKGITSAALGQSDAGDRKTAKLPSGDVIGAVSVAHGKRTPQVVDVEKLTSWISEHRPGEVEVIYETRVRPAFLAVLLKAAKDDGGWLDKDTGEVHPIPGVEIKAGDDYLVITAVDGADALVEQAWRDGDIDIRAALRIEGPKC